MTVQARKTKLECVSRLLRKMMSFLMSSGEGVKVPCARFNIISANIQNHETRTCVGKKEKASVKRIVASVYIIGLEMRNGRGRRALLMHTKRER